MNRGGAETLIMNLYRNIDRSQVQFDFLTHQSEVGAFDDEIRKNGGRIYTVPYGVKTGHFAYVRALNDFFQNHPQYRIVHSHMNETSGIILRSAQKNKVPVRIAHSHTSNPIYSLIKTLYFKGLAKRLIPHYATHCFACSETAGKYMFGRKITEKGEMILLKNGVSSSLFLYNPNVRDKIRYEMGIDSDTMVIGHVGSFQAVKNHSFLLDVFAEVYKLKKKVILLLVGDGALRSEMEQKARSLGLHKHVFFLGIRQEVAELMQSMDVFVFPSLFEGLPVTLVEAQAAGLPCIISDNITKEVDMDAGLIEFAPLGDATFWAHKILRTSCGRVDTTQHIKNKGYDISSISTWIQEFYVRAWS
ncbi:glycosyltransferase family 1 protein [Ammoniphilus sp. YIM 78166]|uniref:glycosyltransferase family 1 protein n=1 Tax=Ammoniphilus sp. YIM 78166 TaxID=1644106 RepID=UPI00106F3898|nr:glycosyltransferase family 1 protein [Ammoniphilus sp. YIM 78166]